MNEITTEQNIEPEQEKGQYFTTNETLQEKVCSFILNKPTCVLEPCVGKGHLVNYIQGKMENLRFDMYEIDETLEMIGDLEPKDVTYQDFLLCDIEKKYQSIVGNPPFVKTKSGNLYHDFIWKCYELLDDKGELVFIVPSDFLKLTSSGKILCEMLENGTFTHIFQPNKENLFDHASIDVIVFRYCKDKKLTNKVIINGTEKYLMNMNGIVTFSDTKKRKVPRALGEDFTIFVGMVSGKEAVFKNNLLGDKEVLNGKNLVENYIILEDFPCDNDKVNEYMLEHKSELMERKIRKFTEKNWYQWGALRNIESVKEHEGKECIYVKTLTRSKEVGFIDNVRLFGGGLLVMIPKKKMNLSKILEKINSESFRNNYMYSGRFKIGHKQLSNAVV